METEDRSWQSQLPFGRIEISSPSTADAQAVRRFLENLSPDSRWLRYHTPTPVVRSWMVNAVVAPDRIKRDALIATHEGEVVGVAEWGRYDAAGRTADVAVVVDDRFRRRGVARELLRHLAANARKNGVEHFSANVLSVNRAMISLVQHVAPERKTRFDGSTVEMLIPLQANA